MSIRLPYLGLPALILILVTAAACDGANSAVTAPAAKPGANALLTTEPATLRSETLTGSCPAGTPFGTRLGVVVRGTQSLILTDLHFRFIDRNGRTAFPDVIAIRSLSAPLPDSSIPTASPIPFPSPSALPGASPIPIPGSLPIEGILLNGGSSRTFPFFLRFDCGVIGDGTLVIVADTTDANGRSMRPELRVRLAE